MTMLWTGNALAVMDGDEYVYIDDAYDAWEREFPLSLVLTLMSKRLVGALNKTTKPKIKKKTRRKWCKYRPSVQLRNWKRVFAIQTENIKNGLTSHSNLIEIITWAWMPNANHCSRSQQKKKKSDMKFALSQCSFIVSLQIISQTWNIISHILEREWETLNEFWPLPD